MSQDCRVCRKPLPVARFGLVFGTGKLSTACLDHNTPTTKSTNSLPVLSAQAWSQQLAEAMNAGSDAGPVELVAHVELPRPVYEPGYEVQGGDQDEVKDWICGWVCPTVWQARYCMTFDRIDESASKDAWRIVFKCTQSYAVRGAPDQRRQRTTPDVKNRDRLKRPSFDCKGSLSVAVVRSSSIVRVAYRHEHAHVPYKRREVSDKVVDIIRANSSLSPAMITRIVRASVPTGDEITADQVRYIHSKLGHGVWRLDEDQVRSAQKLVDSAQDRDGGSYVRLDIQEPGVEAFAWASRTALDQWASQTVELAADSTWKTTGEGYELFAVVAEAQGSGLPLSYLAMRTARTAAGADVDEGALASDVSPGAKQRALEQWLCQLRDRHGLNPSFVLTDKDASEINAFGNVFPRAKHNLCLWHILRAVKKRLQSGVILQQPRYDLSSWAARFDFIDPTFLPLRHPARKPAAPFPTPSQDRRPTGCGSSCSQTLAPAGAGVDHVGVGTTDAAIESAATQECGFNADEISALLSSLGDEGVEQILRSLEVGQEWSGGSDLTELAAPPPFIRFGLGLPTSTKSAAADSESGAADRAGKRVAPQPKYRESAKRQRAQAVLAKRIEESRNVFCPAARQPSIIGLIVKHLCRHPLLPERGVHQPLSASDIYSSSVLETYQYCALHGLPDLWSYLAALIASTRHGEQQDAEEHAAMIGLAEHNALTASEYDATADSERRSRADAEVAKIEALLHTFRNQRSNPNSDKIFSAFHERNPHLLPTIREYQDVEKRGGRYPAQRAPGAQRTMYLYRSERG